MGLVAVPESRGVFTHLTVRENLDVFAGGRSLLPGVSTRFRCCASAASQAAGTLSGGEQRMLSLSRALVAQPRCVVVDEPSLGLAPALTDELYEVVGQHRRHGRDRRARRPVRGSGARARRRGLPARTRRGHLRRRAGGAGTQKLRCKLRRIRQLRGRRSSSCSCPAPARPSRPCRRWRSPASGRR